MFQRESITHLRRIGKEGRLLKTNSLYHLAYSLTLDCLTTNHNEPIRAMLRNFIITIVCNLWPYKFVSSIDIFSLSIGVTAFVLILLNVHHETGDNKFNENNETIGSIARKL